MYESIPCAWSWNHTIAMRKGPRMQKEGLEKWVEMVSGKTKRDDSILRSFFFRPFESYAFAGTASMIHIVFMYSRSEESKIEPKNSWSRGNLAMGIVLWSADRSTRWIDLRYTCYIHDRFARSR